MKRMEEDRKKYEIQMEEAYRKMFQKAEKAREEQIRLEREIIKKEKESVRLQEVANRGILSKFFHEMGEVTVACAIKGDEQFGIGGGIAAGVLGLPAGAVVAALTTVFGKVTL